MNWKVQSLLYPLTSAVNRSEDPPDGQPNSLSRSSVFPQDYQNRQESQRKEKDQGRVVQKWITPKSILVALISSVLMKPVEAVIYFNQESQFYQLSPQLVSSDSKFIIESIYRDDGSYAFKAGDCFEVDFAKIDGYLPSEYVPVPYDLTVCDLNVKATCLKRSQYGFKFSLTEDVLMDEEQSIYLLKGSIGMFKNPYSTQTLTISGIRYYAGCSSSTPTDIAQTKFQGQTRTTFFLDFEYGSITDFKMETSQKVVGLTGLNNIATFTFTPGTILPESGGQVSIKTPIWYGSERNLRYMFDQAVDQCYSPSLNGLTGQSQGDTLVLSYTSFMGPQKGKIEINCRNWQNPILPSVSEPLYMITTKDRSGKRIDETALFSFDTSQYIPYQIPINNIVYTLGLPNIQKLSYYDIQIDLPVPMEMTQCFIKITFPREIKVTLEALTKITGSKLFGAGTADLDRNIVASELSNPSDRYIIVKGCDFQYKRPLPTRIQPKIGLRLNQLMNPYSVRQTSQFKFEIFKEWSAQGGLKLKVQESTNSFVTKEKYTEGQMQKIQLRALNTTVQEITTQILEFSTLDFLPGSDGQGLEEGIQPGFHIYFPNQISRSPNVPVETSIKIKGEDGTEIWSENTQEDKSVQYNENCIQYLCYLVQFNAKGILQPQRFTLTIEGMVNPLSISPPSNILISSLIKYPEDTLFSKVDQYLGTSGFVATKGTVFPATMISSSVTNDLSTFANNQIYKLKFKLSHTVPLGGFIKVTLPQGFFISSQSTAVAQFKVLDEFNDQYSTIFQPSEQYVVGIITKLLKPQIDYTVYVAGVRNPKYLTSNVANLFKVQTFDPNGLDESLQLIDEGEGGDIQLNKLSKIDSFSAEALNTTNGVNTSYFITWLTQIQTVNEDKFFLNFPVEVTIPDDVKCSPLFGISKIECQKDPNNPQRLVTTLKELTQSSGLFKFQISELKNPPSLRLSSPFGAIEHTGPDPNNRIQSYTQVAQIQNEYASNLQGLNQNNIIQESKEYAMPSGYLITFTPYSVIPKSFATIVLTYPSTVSLVDESVSSCGVYVKGSDTRYGKCSQVPGTRMIRIEDAIPAGYDKIVSIRIRMRNPPNNWGTVGVTLRTYEIVNQIDYLIDKLDTNALIPELKCNIPCMQCQEDGKGTVIDKSYCTQCWQDNSAKYLMVYKPYDFSPGANNKNQSTCGLSCPPGYTSNGDKLNHRCVKCNPMCLTCRDDNKVGDKDICVKCAPDTPSFYSPTGQCFKDCSNGFYTVTKNLCDKCGSPCENCVGDKFNCTSCDHESNAPALYNSQSQVLDTTIYRGTCRSNCPRQFFLDLVDQYNPKCQNCISPCSTCIDNGDKCLSCDGSNKKIFQYNYQCYVDCPAGTAGDIGTRKCVECPKNCVKCSSTDAICFECAKPFLLEDGICVSECQKPGYFPNLSKTQCTNLTQFPFLGPIFSIISVVAILTVFIVWRLKRNTKVLPSIVAFVSLLQTISILFQLYLSLLFKLSKQLYFTIFALIVTYLLNLFNYWFIDRNVLFKEAQKRVYMTQAKLKELENEFKLKQKKLQRRQRALEAKQRKFEGGEEEESFSDLKSIDFDRDSSESDEQYEGGKLSAEMLKNNNIEEIDGSYFKIVDIQDKGFCDWVESNERTANTIKWISIFLSFKFYRMTYSYFFNQTQFVVLFQKKKFKKALIVQTLLSMFFVELPILVCDAVALSQLSYREQPWHTFLDTLLICLLLITLEFIEIARLDHLMKTFNKHGHQSMKANSAFVSSDEEEQDDLLPSSDEDEDEQEKDDYPDWRLMLKHVEGNPDLFKLNKLQLTLNDLDKRFDPRYAESCIDFPTEWDKEEDPRLVRSFPPSPRFIDNFKGIDFENFGKTFDNVYAESKPPGRKNDGKTYSEMGTQAQPSDILLALARKGGDLLNPGFDKDDKGEGYLKKKGQKKRRGRKNKYYKQIDAEDDEEADQISDLSKGDGLDGIKEEDDEDEEERLAKIAKQQEVERLEAEIKAKENQRIKQMELEAQKLQAEKDAQLKKKEAQERAKKEAEDKAKADLAKAQAEKARVQAEQEKALAEQEKAKQAKSQAEQDKLNKTGKSIKSNKTDEKAATLKSAKDISDGANKEIKDSQPLHQIDMTDLDKSAPPNIEKPGTAQTQSQKSGKDSEGGDLQRRQRDSGKGHEERSELSNLMSKSNPLIDFGSVKVSDLVEVPPNSQSRRFNENDILGDLERDEKGNIIPQQLEDGQFIDLNGKSTNERGYLVSGKGDVLNNIDGSLMFKVEDLDERGEIPAPFCVERHNFNPHLIRGDFDYDKEGNAIIRKNQRGECFDKRGNRVNSRGFRIDANGNIVDNNERKKIDGGHLEQDGNLPKLFSYTGRRFDIADVIGCCDKDANGNIIPMTDQEGKLVDNLGRRINSKGYLVDGDDNVIAKDGRLIFEKRHLKNEEIPKLFPFSKFNIKNVLGNFEMDPLGNPILDKDSQGNLIDMDGRRVNAKGYLVDKHGNVINKNGKVMFEKEMLDPDQDIPKFFRSGLVRSDTESSLSRLMSEIGKNQPSEFDQEEQKIQEEMAREARRAREGRNRVNNNTGKKSRGSGDTSVDSMMEITPANYNYQNQRFDAEMDDRHNHPEGIEEEDDYGSQNGGFNQTGGMSNALGINELAAKKRIKKKKKKKKKKPVEFEDPSLRDHLLAGAYGGVAKPKPKRHGVKYTTDIDAGLRDIATPASAFIRDPSKRGFQMSSGVEPESARGRRGTFKNQESVNRIRSSHRDESIDERSMNGSKMGGILGSRARESSVQPTLQANDDHRNAQLEGVIGQRESRMHIKKKKVKARISKDADFEKMFGKNIDEFLEDSDWDIESIDKMSQISHGSKQTIRSAAQAGKLKNLQNLYLQRIETSLPKNTMNQTGMPPKVSKRDHSMNSPRKPPTTKQAWDATSKGSKTRSIPKGSKK